MASKMPSAIYHQEEKDDDGYHGQQAQVCRQRQREGEGVHGASEEAKNEWSRSRSYFIIHRMIIHHWHGHKA
jgi:hypothetical protein